MGVKIYSAMREVESQTKVDFELHQAGLARKLARLARAINDNTNYEAAAHVHDLRALYFAPTAGHA